MKSSDIPFPHGIYIIQKGNQFSMPLYKGSKTCVGKYGQHMLSRACPLLSSEYMEGLYFPQVQFPEVEGRVGRQLDEVLNSEVAQKDHCHDGNPGCWCKSSSAVGTAEACVLSLPKSDFCHHLLRIFPTQTSSLCLLHFCIAGEPLLPSHWGSC